LLVGALTWS